MTEVEALVDELRDLASPEAECLPDGYRLTCLIVHANKAADALAASDAARVKAEVALADIASSDDVENALDPARNKRVARAALRSQP